VPPGPVPAGLPAYQLDPKDTAQYYANDVNKAKQLLAAANVDLNKEYDIVCSNSSATNQQAAEVWAQQLSKAGLKVRIQTYPFAEWIKRITTSDYDAIVGGSPGDDTPQRALRLQHSTSQVQLQFMGLKDPTIDALIEKSESVADIEENVKIVKQIEIELLKRYAGVYMLLTQQENWLRSTKLKNYDFQPNLALAQYQTEMWLQS
jgi:peptide/nickel transport system substrate-binding protein